MSRKAQEKTRTKEELSCELISQFKKFRGKILSAESIGRHNEEYTAEALSRILLAEESFNLPEFQEKKQKRDFYRKFIIEIIKKFAEDKQDGASLLLAMNGLLPGYENLSCTDCCDKYFQESDFKRNLANPYDSFQKTYEPRAINSLVSCLLEEITMNQSAELINIAQKILNELLGDTPIGKKDEQKPKESDYTEFFPHGKIKEEHSTNETNIHDDVQNEIILSEEEYNRKNNDAMSHVLGDDNIKEGSQPSSSSENVEISFKQPGNLEKDEIIAEPSIDSEDEPLDVQPESEPEPEPKSLYAFIKKHLLSVSVVAVIIAIILYAIINSRNAINGRITPDWGDSAGGRPSFTAKRLKDNVLGDQIVFNSKGRENEPGECKAIYPGDEKNFVKVQLDNNDPDSNDLWESENITVENGEQYKIRIDINNNNPREHIVAKDTKVALSIPSYSDTQIPVRGYIESSNADPSKIWDGVVFSSAENKSFHLRFRPNTAMLYNKFTGADDGIELSDDIVLKATEGGTLIGYDKLNGEIPGGPQYSGIIEAWVDVIYDKYSVVTQVRKLGEKEWHESVDAEIGEKVEFQIEYNNTSTSLHK